MPLPHDLNLLMLIPSPRQAFEVATTQRPPQVSSVAARGARTCKPADRIQVHIALCITTNSMDPLLFPMPIRQVGPVGRSRMR